MTAFQVMCKSRKAVSSVPLHSPQSWSLAGSRGVILIIGCLISCNGACHTCAYVATCLCGTWCGTCGSCTYAGIRQDSQYSALASSRSYSAPAPPASAYQVCNCVYVCQPQRAAPQARHG
jgi:hypothetical protein